VLAVVIVLVVLCGGAGLLAYFSGVFGGSDPTEVVEDYFAAAQRGDCAKMIELVTEESWRQGGATSRAQAISECEQGMAELGMSGVPVQLLGTRLVSEGSDTAVVAATINPTGGLIDDSLMGPMDVDIALRKEGRDWLIDTTAMGPGLEPPTAPSLPGLDDPLAPPDIEIPDIEIPDLN